VAFRQPVQQTGRLALRLALYEGQASVLAGTVAQEAHQTLALAAGLPSIGWHSFRHTVSAWGKEAGLKLEDVKTLLRHEDIATTSNVYGDLGMDAKRRIQRLVAFVNEQAKRAEDGSRIQKAWARTPVSISAALRDPYLTHVRFKDFSHAKQKNGSSGRTRTELPFCK
jgi:hypothetical protein